MLRNRSSVAFLVLALLSAVPASAADDAAPAPAAPAGSARPFEILDNSFLVEEAFNQEEGVFQNIFSAVRSNSGRWDSSFTQEWPVLGQRHQLSYSVPFSLVESGGGGVGDVLINYRFQVATEHGFVPAFSPRLSLILPSGHVESGFGAGSVGWQVNLPVSKQFGDLYVHANAGVTYLPGARSGAGDDPAVALVSPAVAASAIVRVRPMLNLMCEVIAASNESVTGPGASSREFSVIVSPGLRVGWNIGSRQVVVGAALPVATHGGTHDVGVLTYFSYELPFARD